MEDTTDEQLGGVPVGAGAIRHNLLEYAARDFDRANSRPVGHGATKLPLLNSTLRHQARQLPHWHRQLPPFTANTFSVITK
jgi:hypothetical protein